MAIDSYQSPDDIIEFATRYYAELNRIIANRMQQLGIADDMIGIKDSTGLSP